MFEYLTENPQIIFFLIVFVIFVIQKVLEAGRAKREAEQEQNRPEIEIEDFFPADEADIPPHPPYFPPPLPTASGGGPPPLVKSVSLAPAPNAAAELARQQELDERLRKLRRSQQRGPATPAPAPITPGAPFGGRQSAARPAGALLKRLRHPRDVRQAVLLKEVLDRPVALRR